MAKKCQDSFALEKCPKWRRKLGHIFALDIKKWPKLSINRPNLVTSVVSILLSISFQYYTYSASNESLPVETLTKKFELCQKFENVLTKIDPGYSEIRTFIQVAAFQTIIKKIIFDSILFSLTNESLNIHPLVNLLYFPLMVPLNNPPVAFPSMTPMLRL